MLRECPATQATTSAPSSRLWCATAAWTNSTGELTQMGAAVPARHLSCVAGDGTPTRPCFPSVPPRPPPRRAPPLPPPPPPPPPRAAAGTPPRATSSASCTRHGVAGAERDMQASRGICLFGQVCCGRTTGDRGKAHKSRGGSEPQAAVPLLACFGAARGAPGPSLQQLQSTPGRQLSMPTAAVPTSEGRRAERARRGLALRCHCRRPSSLSLDS